jgi:hypothetical protein
VGGEEEEEYEDEDNYSNVVQVGKLYRLGTGVFFVLVFGYVKNYRYYGILHAVLRIRIHRIRMFLFQPLGSGSVSQRYGSGSGSFYHQAKIVLKPVSDPLIRIRTKMSQIRNTDSKGEENTGTRTHLSLIRI